MTNRDPNTLRWTPARERIQVADGVDVDVAGIEAFLVRSYIAEFRLAYAALENFRQRERPALVSLGFVAELYRGREMLDAGSFQAGQATIATTGNVTMNWTRERAGDIKIHYSLDELEALAAANP